MAKTRLKAIVLSILIAGLGQMYLGNYKRGIAILISATGMAAIANFWQIAVVIPGFLFYIWQIYDASREFYKRRHLLAEIICRNCNWTNNNYSKYCTKCGNEI